VNSGSLRRKLKRIFGPKREEITGRGEKTAQWRAA
jgi:hypothetical protein